MRCQSKPLPFPLSYRAPQALKQDAQLAPGLWPALFFHASQGSKAWLTALKLPPCQRAACNSIALAACCMLVEELVLVDPGGNADNSPLCPLHYWQASKATFHFLYRRAFPTCTETVFIIQVFLFFLFFVLFLTQKPLWLIWNIPFLVLLNYSIKAFTAF